jgi:hypothetical protein
VGAVTRHDLVEMVQKLTTQRSERRIESWIAEQVLRVERDDSLERGERDP